MRAACLLRPLSQTDLRSVLSVSAGLGSGWDQRPACCLSSGADSSSLSCVTVDTLIIHIGVMPFSCRAQDALCSGHVLPLHTGREGCAVKSRHSRNPGDEEGMAPCGEDICHPCSPHILLSFSSSLRPRCEVRFAPSWVHQELLAGLRALIFQ